MLTLGTGVGGCFVVDGRLESGSVHADAAGIFGHMTLHPDGRPCNCGRKGCLEAYCSATAIAKRAQLALGEGNDGKGRVRRRAGESPQGAGNRGRIRRRPRHGARQSGEYPAPRMFRHRRRGFRFGGFVPARGQRNFAERGIRGKLCAGQSVRRTARQLGGNYRSGFAPLKAEKLKRHIGKSKSYSEE